MSEEVYISIDVESDGPCPIKHSMLSLGAAAFVRNSTEPIDTFSANLETLAGATQDSATMAWWGSNMAAYDITRRNLEEPVTAMRRFDKWLRDLPVQGKRVAIAYPAGFDFTYVYVYMHLFLGQSALGFSALDIKTYAMRVLNTPYTSSVKKRYPRAWFDATRKHTHVAVEDAVEQGVMFVRMLNS